MKTFEKEVIQKQSTLVTKVGVAHALAKKMLATHSTDIIVYYLYLFMQTQLQLGSYIHTCTNEIHSLVNLQELIPTLARIIISNTNQPKLGLNL